MISDKLILITADELNDLIQNATTQAVTVALKNFASPATTGGDLLTRQEAASYLGISVSTIDAWAKVGVVPKVIMGTRSVRFRRGDLDRVREVG